jgi:hypothetical protein
LAHGGRPYPKETVLLRPYKGQAAPVAGHTLYYPDPPVFFVLYRFHVFPPVGVSDEGQYKEIGRTSNFSRKFVANFFISKFMKFRWRWYWALRGRSPQTQLEVIQMEQVVTAVTPDAAPVVQGTEPDPVPQDNLTQDGPDFEQSMPQTTTPQDAVAELTPESTEPREMISQGSTPTGEILTAEDKEQHAKSLSDADLLAKVQDTFRNWRQNIPYICEARDRFAQPGRRVPVPGNPTWTEWVERHLGVGIRRVQQLLAAEKEGGNGNGKDGSKNPPKPRFALPGLSEAEIEEMVKRAAEIKPEAASRLMYKALVQPPDLADVRTVVRRCLGGLSQAKQLEMLNEFCDWIEGQIYDLEHSTCRSC